MIYTVTFNPALDYVIQVDHFKTGQINRNKSEKIVYGGKGINVSCILNELDIKSTALGFIADFTGKALENGLEQLGIATDFIEVKQGMTRINVKMKSDEETEINGMGPIICQEDFDCLLNKVKQLKQGDLLILSGNIPSCLKADAYQRVIENLNEGVNFVIDSEKDLLMKTLSYHPFLIKPNNLELQEIFSIQFENENQIIECAKKLQEMGAKNVLVSMAKDGAILVDEKGTIHKQGICKGKVVNSVGAGDSMVAGFIAGFIQTKDYDYALKLGTACGGATAFQSGLATKEQIQEAIDSL
ncbi:1-phosphofructokinase [Floccifex sp.]|uniref:1-phosphofructokinase n=1 Tax=Floccifex sp. TaxID=2815810 RepID=UPI002A75A515|nr:1-phosphofructokinase [Floccifex sp.]MDD7280598.1 1-phosphofructokinase [Erysipelotrichaceae bacterium]MDY2958876.1 1-phosphofructokinase [Floccifex sp.]